VVLRCCCGGRCRPDRLHAEWWGSAASEGERKQTKRPDQFTAAGERNNTLRRHDHERIGPGEPLAHRCNLGGRLASEAVRQVSLGEPMTLIEPSLDLRRTP
jgi:hypothetical protein